jgi:hypothetical protein
MGEIRRGLTIGSILVYTSISGDFTMSQSGDKTPRPVGKSRDLALPYVHKPWPAAACTCARCLEARGAGLVFAHRGDAIYQDIFYEEAAEIPQRVWDDMYDDTASYHRKVEWWKPQPPKAVIQRGEFIMHAFQLFLILAGACGLVVIFAAVVELCK